MEEEDWKRKRGQCTILGRWTSAVVTAVARFCLPGTCKWYVKRVCSNVIHPHTPSHVHVHIVISSFSAEFRAGLSFLKADFSILNVTVKKSKQSPSPNPQSPHNVPPPNDTFHSTSSCYIFSLKILLLKINSKIGILSVDIRKGKQTHHNLPANCSCSVCRVVFSLWTTTI